MKLTDSTEVVNLVEKRIGKNNRFEDSALVFYENTRRDVPMQHNRPLYVTARMRDIEMRRVLIDAGSSLNIIFLDILDDLGIPREKIQKQPFEVFSFNGNRTYTVSSISLDLTVGPIRVAHRFHVIDTQTSYQLLLGRPWIQKYKAVPSTYHQCLKAIWKGKKVHINATGIPFQRDEAHFSEARYFDELAEDGEVIIAQPRGVQLPAWEDLEDNKAEINSSA